MEWCNLHLDWTKEKKKSHVILYQYFTKYICKVFSFNICKLVMPKKKKIPVQQMPRTCDRNRGGILAKNFWVHARMSYTDYGLKGNIVGDNWIFILCLKIFLKTRVQIYLPTHCCIVPIELLLKKKRINIRIFGKLTNPLVHYHPY